jgi:type I restriction-modification system DNA methylase subunit
MAQTKTIRELQAVWNVNKDGFRTHELGKLQDFVKDIFESSQLFALAYGDLRTSNKKRKNEFTRETSKEGAGRGRADMVIFIDGEDVVIPVEVERLGNIRAGESQILQYQTDWRKKYGILTDGNEWRIYFDRWYETFFLQDIFDKTSRFWQKWGQYTAPETYYDMAFNSRGQKELFEAARLDPCAAENRPFFFNDITNLLSVFKSKITVLFPLLATEERQAVETTYSYVIQFILYKVLIDNNYKKLKNDYEVFREWVKKAVQTKKYDGLIKDIKTIAGYIYANVYKPFRQKQESINKHLIEQLKQAPTLDDIAPWLDIIMFIDRYNFAGLRNELFGFVYENYLKELYHEENKGQYFTDSGVVNFMLRELGYTAEVLSKTNGENISIIDPSCGAGTFLYSATLAVKEAFDDGTIQSSRKIERLVNENIYGLDIEEFPLFLAEMNILMQLLPIVVNANYTNVIDEKLKLFITKDSIAEFLDSVISKEHNGKDREMSLFGGFDYDNTPPYMRDKKDLEDLFQSLEGGLDHRKRFDYVIGNPPYIGYNECSRQNMRFLKRLQDKNDHSITMGNVYGVNLNTVKGRKKPYSPKPNLYAFFVALGLALLKDNGKICYIIPQTILTAGDLDVLRYHLAKNTTIEKIITFEGNLFIGRGIKQKKPVATSSLIFIAKKAVPKANHSVKVINYKPYNNKQIVDCMRRVHTPYAFT